MNQDYRWSCNLCLDMMDNPSSLQPRSLMSIFASSTTIPTVLLTDGDMMQTQTQVTSHSDALSEFKRKLKHDWRRTNFEGKVFYVRDEIYRWMVAGKPTNAVRLLATVNQRIKSGKFPEIRSSDLFNPGATCFIVFAILLSLDYGHLIHIFHKHNVTDYKLDWNIEESNDAHDAIRQDLKNEHPNPAKVIAEFERAKWAFNPVPLTLTMHKHLHGVNWILPFTKWSKVAEGGTATVYQVLVQEELLEPDFRNAISAGRQNHDSLKGCYEFAIKEYTKAFEADFEREYLAFRAIRGQEGMVQFLGQFVRERNNADGKRETTYNILLEYGEFDLEEFFGEPQQYPPVLQLEIVLFWESFFKVADAISRVHNLTIKTEDGQTKIYNGCVIPHILQRNL
ncbi:hypothetical protein CONLIGDRAFT_274026 [Coniochaeta ligniaria NRRL 30616]|uniref:Protein kinase domain-containing protein n=1 Tax=Coniochaeta ligniaria NRRL 30616 TaxID=1408157 RepID=A0A1J7JXL7_9PEZI|nr:hypothetical protein CONLIGDRAFT_274026 [Coniochaeta ligniaria NRRL 30616]